MAINPQKFKIGEEVEVIPATRKVVEQTVRGAIHPYRCYLLDDGKWYYENELREVVIEGGR